MKNFKIIIIGGGIGGLCLAQGLKKSGINFTVYEKNKNNTSWLEGYRIHVNPTGSEALNKCLPPKIWEAFLAGTSDTKEGFGFMTEQLKELVFIEEDMMIGYTKDPEKSQYAVSRKMLRYVLQAGLEEQIMYDKNFLRYEHLSDGRVKVFFEDGTSDIGNLLVGADGANSKIRTQLLPGAQRITTDGVAVAGRTLLNEDTRRWLPHSISSRMNVIMPLDKYFFFSASFDHKIKSERHKEEIKQVAINAGITPETFFDHKENYILWAFIAHKKEFINELKNAENDLKKTVLDKMTNWNGNLRRLIMEGDPGSLILLPFKVMLPIKNWPANNVTILGDAVHNMPPLYGMGANMAMHDAALLYKQLVEMSTGKVSLQKSLEIFQEKMLKDGFEAVNVSMKYTKQAISYNWVQRLIARTWFRFCNIFPMMKKYTFGSRWVNNKN